MALGRKGLTSGAIKGLTVCCFTRGWGLCASLVSTLLCMAVAEPSKAVVQELTGRDQHCLHTDLSPVSDTRRSLSAGEES
ncbi:unnamed protein product, partial [Staurois parvus]